MFELLARAAAEHPDRVAVLTHEDAITYAELFASAGRAAAMLQEHRVDRFAIISHDAGLVLPLLAAAAHVGAEACQYPPDPADVVADLAERLDHHVAFTDRDDLDGVLPRLLGAEDLPRDADGSGQAVALGRVRPHLVLTTGTTGAPRGVRHDWSRLRRGVDRVSMSDRDQRWLLAYGLHQFAGLQVMLHVVAAAVTLVAPAPRRPREGLRAARELGVTHASATPTYWRFLLAEMRSDGGPAPTLEQVTMGGEAIAPSVLADVERAFPGAQVSQVYAASEFGSTGSMRDGRAGLSAAVLERGDDDAVAMRVVDGELWIRSSSGMLGYHGEEPVDPDAWRPTGDLVEVEGDRLLFRGRTSEVINVGGVKVHPLPVEERAGAVDGVAVARVFGRPNPMVGSIVALEIVAEAGADRDQVKAAVRAACEDLVPAARPRSIQFVDDLTTVGGKIVRSPR